jgi:hypothetical protein
MPPTLRLYNNLQFSLEDINHGRLTLNPRTSVPTAVIVSGLSEGHYDRGSVIAIIVILSIAGLGFLLVLVGVISSCCCSCSSRSRGGSSGVTAEQTSEIPTEAQNRRYNRRKSRSSPRSSRQRCSDDVPLGGVRNEAQGLPLRPGVALAVGDATVRQSSQEDQPPEYQPASPPAQLQSVYLNPTQNSSRVTINSVSTTATLPSYHRSHQDQLCEVRGVIGDINGDSTPAPSYSLHLDSWSR